MEFNLKLQELRKNKGLTQEQLASELYVSRTAISKWESGRGYPSIDSLKIIAKFFSVSVDSLISSDEILILAEEQDKRKKSYFVDLIYGLLDLFVILMLFIPFFATKNNDSVKSISLIYLNTIQTHIKISYYVIITTIVLFGILTLSMQNYQGKCWVKYKTAVSLLLNALLLLIFIISLQPYASVFSFMMLTIKCLVIIKTK